VCASGAPPAPHHTVTVAGPGARPGRPRAARWPGTVISSCGQGGRGGGRRPTGRAAAGPGPGLQVPAAGGRRVLRPGPRARARGRCGLRVRRRSESSRRISVRLRLGGSKQAQALNLIIRRRDRDRDHRARPQRYRDGDGPGSRAVRPVPRARPGPDQPGRPGVRSGPPAGRPGPGRARRRRARRPFGGPGLGIGLRVTQAGAGSQVPDRLGRGNGGARAGAEMQAMPGVTVGLGHAISRPSAN
jgi:hypothetical protein